MENAGRGCVDVLERLGIDGPVVILCGKGNNAGDGFVIARHLEIRGHVCRVLLLCPPDDLRGDAATNFAILQKTNVPIVDLSQRAGSSATPNELADAAWLVDALLGTGARGEPRPPFDTAIDWINARRATTQALAVDVPSGLDCDTGQPAAHTVRADHTCTFAAMKIGFTQPAAKPYVGTVHVCDIGVPPRLIRELAQHCGELILPPDDRGYGALILEHMYHFVQTVHRRDVVDEQRVGKLSAALGVDVARKRLCPQRDDAVVVAGEIRARLRVHFALRAGQRWVRDKIGHECQRAVGGQNRQAIAVRSRRMACSRMLRKKLTMAVGVAALSPPPLPSTNANSPAIDAEFVGERLLFRRERGRHRVSALGESEQHQARIGADVIAHLQDPLGVLGIRRRHQLGNLCLR